MMSNHAEESIENDELVEAVTHHLLRHGESSLSDAFLDFLFSIIEERRDERCGSCHLAYRAHAVRAFYGVKYHAFVQAEVD